MKKIAISILAFFTVIFVCMGFTVKYANDKVYALLYPYEEQIFVEDSPAVVTLKKGDCFTSGAYNGERLVWKCIYDDKAQCERIIEFIPYDAEGSDWKSSDLRAWLNSEDGFFGEASISEELVSGEVYLFSQSELEKIGSIAKQPTLSAIRNSNSKYLFIRRNCWYWTSSSISTNSQSVATVTQNGSFYKTLSTDSLTGVCPAFTLKNRTVHVLGGDGSKQKPYVIG